MVIGKLIIFVTFFLYLFISARQQLLTITMEKTYHSCNAVMVIFITEMSQLLRLWYLLHRRKAKPQASLRIRTVSPEPSLFAHIKYGSRRSVRQKIGHLSLLYVCACAFEK